MLKSKKQWVYTPPKPTKPKLPSDIRALLEQKVNELLPRLKTRFLKPPPTDWDFNYLSDIWTKTYRHYFYFCGTYTCPGPNALVPHFEVQFARLEYAGQERFHLSYMRHTGKWWELYQDLELDEALNMVETEPYFFPV